MATRGLSDFLQSSDFDLIDGYKVPKPLKIKPIKALKSVLGLVANKEDTRRVYDVTNAISGRAHQKKFERFIRTPYGRHIIDKKIDIAKVLCDRERLQALPEGSVGREYYAFLAEEDLSETALLEATRDSGIDYLAPNNFEDFTRQVIHFKVTHDLWHVLTGYGRDGLGEICLLEFYLGQWSDHGIRLIVSMAALSLRRNNPDLPVRALLKEARKNSRHTKWIMGEDIEAYLSQPLAAVRQRLNISQPSLYASIPANVKAQLLQPNAKTHTLEPVMATQ